MYLFCSDEVCKLFLCTVSLLWRIHSLVSNRTSTLISSLYSFSKGTEVDIRSMPSAGHLSTDTHICGCMSEFLGLPPPPYWQRRNRSFQNPRAEFTASSSCPRYKVSYDCISDYFPQVRTAAGVLPDRELLLLRNCWF